MFFVFPQDKTVLENDVVTFRCFALATPIPSVSWVYNGTALSYGDKYSLGTAGINFGALTVRNVSFYDRGRYTCTYNNTHGQLSASTTLTVQGNLICCFVCICIIILSFSVRPRFEEINVPISGTAGGMVLLSCRSSGFPTPSIVWRRNGTLLLQNSKFSIFISSVVLPEQERISTRVSRLEISNLVLGDELEYSCFAENDLARPQQQESSRELIKILCEFAY